MWRLTPILVINAILAVGAVIALYFLLGYDLQDIQQSINYNQIWSSEENQSDVKKEKSGHAVENLLEKLHLSDGKILSMADLKAAARSALSECSCRPEGAWRPDDFRIPSILHLLRTTENPLNFTEMVCFRAMLTHLRPEKIYIHTSVYDLMATGGYWSNLAKDLNISEKMRMKMNKDAWEQEMFGKVGANEKAGQTLTMIQVLKQYGGIFIDTNILLNKPIDDFRSEEFFLVPFGASTELGKGILMGSIKDSSVIDSAYERLRYGPEANYLEDLTRILTSESVSDGASGTEVTLDSIGDLLDWPVVRLNEDVRQLALDQLPNYSPIMHLFQDRLTEDQS